jgi:hypothetical protein
MKSIRILGLGVVAALAVMAFVGAGSASAVTLCKANESPCTGTNKYPSGTAVSAHLKEGTVALLKTNIVNVTCSESETSGENTLESGSPLTGLVRTLSFGECETVLGTPCTVTVVHLDALHPYNASIAATGGGNGTLTVTGNSLGNPGATVECATVINCTFTTASAALSVTGGTMALAKASEVTLSQSGIKCPSTSTWNAEYRVTAPEPLWVEASP